jgi:phosphoribosylamine--glycine ligase/phosphoribosylformylglycinamidine cyclo-ligase
MLTPSGPKVLEYNVRYGDPETQVLIPLLADECDLAEIMLACAQHVLFLLKIHFNSD